MALYRSLLATALLALHLATASEISNQGFFCGAHGPTQQQLDIHRKMAYTEETKPVQSYAEPTIQVDTYFHVVVSSTAYKETPNNQTLNYQLDVLNKSFNESGISFTLVHSDWTYNPTWAVGTNELAMKKALRKGGRAALNLYFLQDIPGGIGICTFPNEYDTLDGPTYDGCMVAVSTVPGGSSTLYNQGKTAVHEIGHWFGLLHTFSGGCVGDGDLVADTPASESASQGCPIGRDSCPRDPGFDPIHNFMDYSSDACYSEFSPGQVVRMRSMWNKFRRLTS